MDSTRKTNYSQNIYSAEKVLEYLSDTSVIDLYDVQMDMFQHEIRKVITEQHHRPIWLGRDGRWRTYVHEGTTRRQIAKKHREDLEQVLYEFYIGKNTHAVHQHTLESLYPNWLAYKKLHTRAETYIIHIQGLWRNYYADTPIVKKNLCDITMIDMDYWVHSLILEHNLTKKQYYNITMIMRQMLEYAVRLDIISESPLSCVKVNSSLMFRNVRKQPSESQVYTRDEVKLMERLAWSDYASERYRINVFTPLALVFQFQTGLRLCEVCAVKNADIIGQQLTVRRLYRDRTKEVVETTKGAFGEREVYLTQKARFIIETVTDCKKQLGLENEYLFSTTDKPLAYGSLATIYKRYCTRLGIPIRSSHKARKTYASCLIDAGVNINTVRELLGHIDERTTLSCYCYDRLNEDDRYQMIEHALQSQLD